MHPDSASPQKHRDRSEIAHKSGFGWPHRPPITDSHSLLLPQPDRAPPPSPRFVSPPSEISSASCLLDTQDIRTWLEKRNLSEFTKLFEKHRIDFEVLGDLTYEDIKEMGVTEIGARRKVYRAITNWAEDREFKKSEAIRAKMLAQDQQTMQDDVGQRLGMLRKSLSTLPQQ